MIKQKYKKELSKLSKQIIEKYKPEKIILFGGLAAGKINKDSDIDLLVIKKSKKNYWQRADEIARIINIDLPSDILNITPKELDDRLSINDDFLINILKNGKVIYEKQSIKKSKRLV